MIRYVLMDIEGTTTPVTFVHKVLFPYARERLAAFVAAHAGDVGVRRWLDEARRTVQTEGGATPAGDAGVVRQLEAWTDADRKHPALKALQGMIWRAGYAEGAYTAEVYADVAPALRTWRERGLTLGIYSSGSVEAQKLLFAHTDAGDLTPLLSDYFDTGVGAKQDASAYQKIAAALALAPASILFLSDVPAELDAASAAGFVPGHLVRPGTAPSPRYAAIPDFDAVTLTLSRRP